MHNGFIVTTAPIVIAVINVMVSNAKDYGLKPKQAPLLVIGLSLVISVGIGLLAGLEILDIIIYFGLNAGIPMASYDIIKTRRLTGE